MKYIIHDLKYKKISEAILTKSDCFFNAPGISLFENIKINYLKNMNQLWNEKEFFKINIPKIIYGLTEEEIKEYSFEDDIRVLDCPIKFPNSDYRLPKELMHLKGIIEKIASHEHEINSKINDYYCYITLDRRLVKSGDNTRKGGIHVDGFQGDRIKERLPVDHSYLIHSNNPTIFYNQKFKVESYWDKKCHNFFSGFELQKRKENIITYPNNTVILIDAYTLHESQIVEKDTYRTFLRLSYTVREFDRLGNAHNPMFDYDWIMLPRDIQKDLVCPIKTN